MSGTRTINSGSGSPRTVQVVKSSAALSAIVTTRELLDCGRACPTATSMLKPMSTFGGLMMPFSMPTHCTMSVKIAATPTISRGSTVPSANAVPAWSEKPCLSLKGLTTTLPLSGCSFTTTIVHYFFRTTALPATCFFGRASAILGCLHSLTRSDGSGSGFVVCSQTCESASRGYVRPPKASRQPS